MILLAVASAFLLGVYLGDRLAPPVSALLLLTSGSLLVGLLLKRIGRSAYPAILVLCVVAGCLRSTVMTDPTAELARYHTQSPIQVEGLVLEDAGPSGAAVRFPVRIERVQAEGEWVEVDGVALVTAGRSVEALELRDPPHIRYGDRLRLEGPLTAPPKLDGFDYPAYLARQGIGSVMSFPGVTIVEDGQGVWTRSALFRVRRSLHAALSRSTPEPEASIGQALLLGMRDTIPDAVLDDFRATGTSHLLAISGLHVGILMALVLPVSARAFGRRRSLYLIVPLLAVWLYAILAGLSPSVVRASIMGTVFLAALALGRPKSILPALGLAAAVMVAVSPNILWSVSFQLSFAAMAGIATLSGPISRRLEGLFGVSDAEDTASRLPIRAVTGAVGVSAAAILATMPLTAFYFQQVSVVGLPTTLVTLPILPFALVFHALAGVVGLVVQPLGAAFGWLAWGATTYIVQVVHLAAKLPIASFETGRIAPMLVLGYFGVGAAWFIADRSGALANVTSRVRSKESSRHVLSAPAKWLAVPMALAAALIWTAALTERDGRLHVVFADVGNGDSTLIISPSGRQVLVDGGPDARDATRLLGSALPFWDRSLDVVVLTHGHADHITGLLDVLRRYDVGHIVERNAEYTTPDYQSWRHAVGDEDSVATQARTNQLIDLGDGATIEVLHPSETLMTGTDSDLNNASIVLRVVYGDVSFLLTGDIFVEAEREMLSRGVDVRSTVLKVPHHGSRTSSSPEFVEQVAPSVAVISVGADNRFGHPHAEPLEVLRRHAPAARVMTTRDHGTIRFATDGTTLSVETER
ncbi:MAG: DNA internalization-related competence protein ComEC/Rec2 [Chloroflexi bacterium]|nr:DNA internalization-related competence protein ComEC/Rec2 [Chloroflexota bacterium]